VTIDVIIASGPREVAGGEMTPAALLELEKAGKLEWLTRMRLATVENDRAQVQIGERAPVVTGRVSRGGFPGGDGSQNVTTLINVGATVETIARVVDDGSIVINLTAEKTWLEPAAAPAEGGEGPPAPQPAQRTGTLTSKSTVRVQPGEPTLVAAQSSSSATGKSQIWIMLTARAAEGSKPATVDKAASALTVFHLKFAKAADVAKVLEAVFDKQPLKISADERTNSVLIQASAVTMEMVKAILTQLDAEQPRE
jgi:type II secretory pathway component HofQ